MRVDGKCSYPVEYLNVSLLDCAITQPNVFKGGFLYKKKKKVNEMFNDDISSILCLKT